MNFNFAFLYLKYYFTAGTKHDVHSPFVYELVTKVIPNERSDEFDEIESVRRKLLHDKSVLNTEVFGAGSVNGKSISLPLNQVTRNSSKNKKYCSLLYRIVKFYQPAVMLELGTAVGMSAMYIAKGNPAGLLYTIEGSNAIASIAIENFKAASVFNIKLINGTFDEKLPELLKDIGQLDFIYIDGNHLMKPTLSYFELCLEKSHKNTIFVFDDINWSEEMQAAWSRIKNHSKVTMTIDLFVMGLVFLNPDFSRQDFIIRF